MTIDQCAHEILLQLADHVECATCVRQVTGKPCTGGVLGIEVRDGQEYEILADEPTRLAYEPGTCMQCGEICNELIEYLTESRHLRQRGLA